MEQYKCNEIFLTSKIFSNKNVLCNASYPLYIKSKNNFSKTSLITTRNRAVQKNKKYNLNAVLSGNPHIL